MVQEELIEDMIFKKGLRGISYAFIENMKRIEIL